MAESIYPFSYLRVKKIGKHDYNLYSKYSGASIGSIQLHPLGIYHGFVVSMICDRDCIYFTDGFNEAISRAHRLWVDYIQGRYDARTKYIGIVEPWPT